MGHPSVPPIVLVFDQDNRFAFLGVHVIVVLLIKQNNIVLSLVPALVREVSEVRMARA